MIVCRDDRVVAFDSVGFIHKGYRHGSCRALASTVVLQKPVTEYIVLYCTHLDSDLLSLQRLPMSQDPAIHIQLRQDSTLLEASLEQRLQLYSHTASRLTSRCKKGRKLRICAIDSSFPAPTAWAVAIACRYQFFSNVSSLYNKQTRNNDSIRSFFSYTHISNAALCIVRCIAMFSLISISNSK